MRHFFFGAAQGETERPKTLIEGLHKKFNDAEDPYRIELFQTGIEDSLLACYQQAWGDT